MKGTREALPVLVVKVGIVLAIRLDVGITKGVQLGVSSDSVGPSEENLLPRSSVVRTSGSVSSLVVSTFPVLQIGVVHVNCLRRRQVVFPTMVGVGSLLVSQEGMKAI